MPNAPLRRMLAGALFVAGALSFPTAGCTSESTTTAPPAKETPRRNSVACNTGETTTPVQAFDLTPDAASGTTCDLANVLDDDGNVTSLAWSGSGTHAIDGHDVTGCVAAEFGDDITLDSLAMNMHPAPNACGHACTPGGEEGCGTGWKVSIFAGPSLDELEWLQQLSLTTADPFEYKVVIYKQFKAKVVAICREPTPSTGDAIAIDAISGTCR